MALTSIIDAGEACAKVVAFDTERGRYSSAAIADRWAEDQAKIYAWPIDLRPVSYRLKSYALPNAPVKRQLSDEEQEAEAQRWKYERGVWALKRTQRRITPKVWDEEERRWVLNRVARCGFDLNKRNGSARQEFIRDRSDPRGRVYMSGAGVCGSVHLCPCCSPKIALRNRDEIESGLRSHFEDGGGALWITTNIPHGVEDDPEITVNAVIDSFAAIFKGTAWQGRGEYKGAKAFDGLKQQLRWVGNIKVLENRTGENGQHPHVHAILLTETPVPYRLIREFRSHAQGVLTREAEKRGLRAPSLDYSRRGKCIGCHVEGVEIRRSGDIARYVTKFDSATGLSAEMTMGDWKQGRKEESLSPFQLLALADEDPIMAARWNKYADVMAGKHGVTWSRGLKERFGIKHVADRRKAEEAEAQMKDPEVVFSISNSEWKEVCRQGREAELHRAVEEEGAAGGERVMASVSQQAERRRRPGAA